MGLRGNDGKVDGNKAKSDVFYLESMDGAYAIKGKVFLKHSNGQWRIKRGADWATERIAPFYTFTLF